MDAPQIAHGELTTEVDGQITNVPTMEGLLSNAPDVSATSLQLAQQLKLPEAVLKFLR